MAATELSLRSERLTLAPGGPAPEFVLHGLSQGATWRIIEASSARARPFDLRLAWSGGDSSGSEAWISVTHAARVCVFAASVEARAQNRHAEENPVRVAVVDGFAETRNQWEQRGDVDEAMGLLIPPFALNVTVQLLHPDLLPRAALVFLDDAGAPVAQHPLGLHAVPVPLGAASGLRLSVPSPTRFRAVFTLAL